MSEIISVEPGRVYDTWARATYDYEGGGDGDLKLKKGDVIEVTNKLETGWWNGTVDGHNRGWFPASHVEQCDSPLQPELGKISPGTWVRALQDEEGLDETALAFKKGDRIAVTHKPDCDRWIGTVTGATSGWFLASNVEEYKGIIIIERRLEHPRPTRM